jgi:hypothetical protein
LPKDRLTILTQINVRSFGMSNDISVPTLSSRAKFSMIIYEMSFRRILFIGANLSMPMPEQFLFLMRLGAFVRSAGCMGSSEANFIMASPTSQSAPPAALRSRLFQTT